MDNLNQALDELDLTASQATGAADLLSGLAARLSPLCEHVPSLTHLVKWTSAQPNVNPACDIEQARTQHPMVTGNVNRRRNSLQKNDPYCVSREVYHFKQLSHKELENEIESIYGHRDSSKLVHHLLECENKYKTETSKDTRETLQTEIVILAAYLKRPRPLAVPVDKALQFAVDLASITEDDVVPDFALDAYSGLQLNDLYYRSPMHALLGVATKESKHRRFYSSQPDAEVEIENTVRRLSDSSPSHILDADITLEATALRRIYHELCSRSIHFRDTLLATGDNYLIARCLVKPDLGGVYTPEDELMEGHNHAGVALMQIRAECQKQTPSMTPSMPLAARPSKSLQQGWRGYVIDTDLEAESTPLPVKAVEHQPGQFRVSLCTDATPNWTGYAPVARALNKNPDLTFTLDKYKRWSVAGDATNLLELFMVEGPNVTLHKQEIDTAVQNAKAKIRHKRSQQDAETAYPF